jgi:hypothetical protein
VDQDCAPIIGQNIGTATGSAMAAIGRSTTDKGLTVAYILFKVIAALIALVSFPAVIRLLVRAESTIERRDAPGCLPHGVQHRRRPGPHAGDRPVYAIRRTASARSDLAANALFQPRSAHRPDCSRRRGSADGCARIRIDMRIRGRGLTAASNCGAVQIENGTASVTEALEKMLKFMSGVKWSAGRGGRAATDHQYIARARSRDALCRNSERRGGVHDNERWPRRSRRG